MGQLILVLEYHNTAWADMLDMEYKGQKARFHPQSGTFVWKDLVAASTDSA